MNLYDYIKKKAFLIELSLLSAVLLIRLSLLNEFLSFGALNYLGIIIALISAVTHIYIIKNTKGDFNLNDNALKNGETSNIEIERYVRGKILSLFGLSNKADNNGNAKKYILITASALVALLLFLGKLVIDIKNLFSAEYTYGTAVIAVYAALELGFIAINIIKAKAVGCNILIDFAEALLFLFGINLFVFAEGESARFQVLVAAAYFCCLFVLKTRDLIKMLENSEN